ncbi:MAG TPA: hypothetical protein DEA38_02230 [Stenotrophomonas sp.]|nr:hypothetical protein [Stenotrophomonas sp.]
MRITLQNGEPVCPYGDPAAQVDRHFNGTSLAATLAGRSIPVDLLLAIGEVALVAACLLGLVHVADRAWRRRKR